jgi:AbrB family looped-hinge helix DNA binding protein
VVDLPWMQYSGASMSDIAPVQSRGRITIPADVRRALQVAPGDEVVFIETAPGRFEIKANARHAALLSSRRSSRLEVPGGRRTPQLELPL